MLVVEELTFQYWKDKIPKPIKAKLSRWIKGYIQQRLEFICQKEGISLENVNPAYTSQICHHCGRFGKRNGKTFVCPECGKIDADINAAHNIKNRYNDKEIKRYTPYKKVKEILVKRNQLR
jgi:transposase